MLFVEFYIFSLFYTFPNISKKQSYLLMYPFCKSIKYSPGLYNYLEKNKTPSNILLSFSARSFSQYSGWTSVEESLIEDIEKRMVNIIDDRGNIDKTLFSTGSGIMVYYKIDKAVSDVDVIRNFFGI